MRPKIKASQRGIVHKVDYSDGKKMWGIVQLSITRCGKRIRYGFATTQAVTCKKCKHA